MNGKGVSHVSGSPSSSPLSSKGKSFGGRFKGVTGKGGPYKGSSGPCLVCNKFGHDSSKCPDRFSPGGGVKGKPSYDGFKGKGKLKGKSKSYFVDFHLNVLAAQWDDSAVHGRSNTKAIIDTGNALAPLSLGTSPTTRCAMRTSRPSASATATATRRGAKLICKGQHWVQLDFLFWMVKLHQHHH